MKTPPNELDPGREDHFVGTMRLRHPSCRTCKHLARPGFKYCTAFPEGIPFEIVVGQVKHIKPYKNDHGIQFEPMDPEV